MDCITLTALHTSEESILLILLIANAIIAKPAANETRPKVDFTEVAPPIALAPATVIACTAAYAPTNIINAPDNPTKPRINSFHGIRDNTNKLADSIPNT